MTPEPMVAGELAMDGLDRATIEAGPDGLVAVQATASELTVLRYALSWVGHTLVPVHAPEARFALPLDQGRDAGALREAIASAIAARRARFFTCASCGLDRRPESLWRDRICMRCAEERHGVVF